MQMHLIGTTMNRLLAAHTHTSLNKMEWNWSEKWKETERETHGDRTRKKKLLDFCTLSAFDRVGLFGGRFALYFMRTQFWMKSSVQPHNERKKKKRKTERVEKCYTFHVRIYANSLGAQAFAVYILTNKYCEMCFELNNNIYCYAMANRLLIIIIVPSLDDLSTITKHHTLSLHLWIVNCCFVYRASSAPSVIKLVIIRKLFSFRKQQRSSTHTHSPYTGGWRSRNEKKKNSFGCKL